MISYRKIHYRGLGKYKENAVTYVKFGNQIVFMGMTKARQSTVCAALEIVNEIVLKECVDPTTVAFYDLQTHMGYSHLKPGQFVFHELVCNIKNGVVVGIPERREGHCHADAIKYFQGYISDSGLRVPLSNVGPIQGSYYPIQRIQ